MPLTRPKHNQINTASAKFTDPLLELNAELTGNNINDMGLILRRGTSGDNAAILWDRSVEEFVLCTTTATGASTGDISFTSYADLQVKQLKTAGGLTYPILDGSSGQVLTTDGNGNLSFTNATGGIQNVVEDTTPQLGGDLDLNGNDITDATEVNFIVNSLPALSLYPAGGAQPNADPDRDVLYMPDGDISIAGNVNAARGFFTGNNQFPIWGIRNNVGDAAGDLNVLYLLQYEGDLSGDAASFIVRLNTDTKDCVLQRAAGGAIGFGTGASVAASQIIIESDGTLHTNTTDYETLVTDDDDIPNKKYVDDLADDYLPLTGGTLTGTLAISDTAPALKLIETDGTAGFNESWLVLNADNLGIQHRDGSGVYIAQGYVLNWDTTSGGVEDHRWYIGSGSALAFMIDSSRRIITGNSATAMVGAQGGALTISTGDSGLGAAAAAADDLIIESDGDAGISIVTPNTNAGSIYFADSDGFGPGRIVYDHSTNELGFTTAGVSRMTLSDELTIRTITYAANSPIGGYFIESNSTPNGWRGGLGMLSDAGGIPYMSLHVPDSHIGFTTKEAYSAQGGANMQHRWYVGASAHALTLEVNGTLHVETANYETLVTDDDDIPNKKYVDDAITTAGGSYVAKSGDTMTGTLNVNTTATSGLIINSGAFNTSAQFISTDNTCIITFEDDSTTLPPYIGAIGDELVLRAPSGSHSVTVQDNLIVTGNLTVQGTQFIVDSNTVNIGDNIITLNADETGVPSQNAGIEIERGTSANVAVLWNEASDTWTLTADGTNYHTIWTAGNDGSGSGLDADTLDGQHATEFHAAGYSAFSGDSVAKDDITTRTDSGFYETSTGTTAEGWPVTNNNWQHMIACTHSNNGNYFSMQIAGPFSDQNFYGRKTNNNGSGAWSKFWTDTNDGTGSGLDADLLDGQQGSYYAAAADYLPLAGGTVTGNTRFAAKLYTGTTAGVIGTEAGSLGIYTGPSGVASAEPNADDLVIENDSSAGISILTPNGSNGAIYFGDPESNTAGRILYAHGSNAMFFYANDLLAYTIDSGRRNIFAATLPDVTLRGAPGAVTISTGDSGLAAASTAADDLIIESGANAGITIATPNTNTGSVYFGDPQDADIGGISYDHANNRLLFTTNANWQLIIESDGTLHANAANYETLVTDDDDIPNKKYVDDLAGNYLPLSGGALTGAVTSTSTIEGTAIEATNVAELSTTGGGGFHMEWDGTNSRYKHHITYNDGGGNWNLRVANIHSGGVLCTEDGHIMHQAFAQATGSFDIKISTASETTGDLVTSFSSYNFSAAGNLTVPNEVTAVQFNGEATSAQYADLAENYTADDDYEPGTVLSFGGTAEVTACLEDHSRNIVGVVSTHPAHLMNANCEGDHVVAIALMGRVPCKVSGKVNRGDLLVADGKGGARAENDPKYGAIIGRAIESFSGDTGVIEVLVGRV
mgnify:CR=1 FL=1